MITIRRMMRVSGLPRTRLLRAVRIAAGERRIGELSVVLAGDEVLADLHLRFMDDPSPTDVLTFDLSDAPADPTAPIAGEVVVSVDTARREARRRKIAEHLEVLRYVVHGVLHLTGMDDATPALRRQMRRAEDAVLAALPAGGVSRKSSRSVRRRR